MVKNRPAKKGYILDPKFWPQKLTPKRSVLDPFSGPKTVSFGVSFGPNRPQSWPQTLGLETVENDQTQTQSLGPKVQDSIDRPNQVVSIASKLGPVQVQTDKTNQTQSLKQTVSNFVKIKASVLKIL